MGTAESKEGEGYTIRKLTTGDLDQYNALLRYAFQVTEQDLAMAGWRDDEIKQSKFPVLERADIWGCYDGEELVSQFAVYPLEMNIYNKKCSIGFVTSVSTYPEYSGRGIMKMLMKRSLQHMRERHQSLALLNPYSIPLYRRRGWEIISNKISYRIRDCQIPSKVKAPGHVRRVDWSNSDFKKLHMRFASQTHGCLYRNALAWEEYWRWDEDDTVVAIYYSAADEPLGYMVYLLKEDIMHIKEMIYLNREAQKGLWEYIHAHDSMIDEVRGNTYYNEPVAFDMDDGDIRETIRPYIMGRIVDVGQFFEKYSCQPSADMCIAFDIEDPLLEWNNGTFRVLFQGGQCFLTDREADLHVSMNISTLTTLLLGYKTAAQLWRMERIQGKEGAAGLLDDVLLHEPPYISDYI